MKLEIGKWYKNLGGNLDYIGKFYKESYGTSHYISEYIYKNKYRKTIGTIDFRHAVLITDLSEIEQYLPLGHCDAKRNRIIELW